MLPQHSSGCSAEHSFEQCGRNGGFWGGQFGDHVAWENQAFGGLTGSARDALDLHFERMSNSQAGKGFITHAEVNELASILFEIHYALYDDGSSQAWFNRGAITVYQVLSTADRVNNIIRDIGGAI